MRRKYIVVYYNGSIHISFENFKDLMNLKIVENNFIKITKKLKQNKILNLKNTQQKQK